LETADGVDPMALAASLNDPVSTVRTKAARPVVFSRIVVIPAF
jgi:hypothetical protein